MPVTRGKDLLAVVQHQLGPGHQEQLEAVVAEDGERQAERQAHSPVARAEKLLI